MKVRAALLAAVLIAGAVVYFQTDYAQYLTKDRIAQAILGLRAMIAGMGYWGPPAFIGGGALAILAFIPAFVVIFFAVSLFGGVSGVLISTASIYLATIGIYFTAQCLGRDFVVRLFGRRLERLEARLGDRGFRAVFYLRLLFFEAAPLNWLLALSNISFRHFFWGTVLGTAHHIVLLAWMTDMVMEAIVAGGSLSPLENPRLMAPIGLGAVVFMVVRLTDRLRMRGARVRALSKE